MSNNDIRVVELFAGVGGFRVGLEKASSRYKTVWANQWEPNKKVQHAYNCYTAHFGVSENHNNEDILAVKTKVPTHDLLVGGFPCQDYSVARTGAKGIEGVKGVLWWNIRDIIENHHPQYVLLENVDRLIKSPSSQRGRDFAIMLRCLQDLNYAVEWRVINAAEYGQAQRRRRIFILAYSHKTSMFRMLDEDVRTSFTALSDWVLEKGLYASAFPLKLLKNPKKCIYTDISKTSFPLLTDISDKFKSFFYNSGIMINGRVYSEEFSPVEIEPIPLRNILEKDVVNEKYYLAGTLEKWKFLKGAKKISRIKPNGEPYFFSEGGMSFPDDLDKPARTMLTSESSVNRSTHVIQDPSNEKLRLLTPVECERLNGFPDNWTNTGMPEKFRYFTMGNALVVPLVTRIGAELLKRM